MLSPTDISVVLVGTIVATGLTLSMPLVFMAVLPGCITPDPRCFDYAREVTFAVSKREDVDPCDDFYRCVADTYLTFHKRSVNAHFRHDVFQSLKITASFYSSVVTVSCSIPFEIFLKIYQYMPVFAVVLRRALHRQW